MINETELKELIERKYNSVRAFSLENDIPYTTMRSILERGVMNAKAETIFKICSILGIRPEELSSSFTLTSSTSTSISSIQQIYDKLEEPRQKKVLVFAQDQLDEQNIIKHEINEPLTEYHVYEKLSAGDGESYWDDRNYDTVFYDENLPHDLASWVYGDSMEPKFQSGSVALIKDTGFDYDGAIYAVDWDGQSYLKKVYKEKDGLRLVSLNDKYDDKFARWEENPRIIGKVIGNFMPVEI